MRTIFQNGAICLVGLALAFTFGCGKSTTNTSVGSATNKTLNTSVLDGNLSQPLVYTSQCTNGQTIAVGASYKLNNNIWGAGTDGAGSQCVWYDSSTLQWGCNASHTSGTAQNIKGYPALVRGWIWFNSTGSIWAVPSDATFPVQLSHLATCLSNWSMTVPTNGEKYDSSYDIWLDSLNNPNYKAKHEVMIWLNYKGPAYNGTDFKPVGNLEESNIHVAANDWNTFYGWNGTNWVYTFRRATNTSSVTNLDIKALLQYAQNKGHLQSTYYLLGIQAGWEIVAGGAFTTTSYTTTITKN